MEYNVELKNFLAEYEQYKAKILDPTHEELKNLLRTWEKPEFWNKYNAGKGVATPSPIRMTMTRIKHPEKVVDKIFRKSDLFPKGLSCASLQDMHDAIGVRVIVYFSSQLPLIDRELRNSDMFEISEINPPEAYLNSDIHARLGLSHIEQKNKGERLQRIEAIGIRNWEYGIRSEKELNEHAGIFFHNLINSSCVMPICLIIFFKSGMPISFPPCGFGINILCFPFIMY